MVYNELMQLPGKRINPKVFYYQKSEKIEIFQDNIKLAKPFFNASLVGTVMRGLELELTLKLPNIPIYFENTVVFGTNSATKTIGPYFLKKEPEFNADNRTYTHKLYDNFITTMVDYEPVNIDYPCTVLNFFKALCEKCGFTTSITSLPNGTRILNYDIYTGINYTYRDVFDDIGQATATLFKININNIEKCSLGTDVVTINDDILKNQNILMGEHFGPINSIILSRSADADYIYKRDETLTEWNEFKISDNQLMNDNNRSDYLDELYDALYGIEYDVFDLELVGFGGFEPLQRANIETDNKSYQSYIFNNEEKYTQGYEESIYTERPEESKPDYTSSDKTDKRINQTYIIAKKQTGEIEALTSRTTILENNTKNMYSIEQVNQLVQNAETGVTNTFSEAGGNNVFRNTGLWFEDSSRDYLLPSNDLLPSNNLYLKSDAYFEYWSGKAIKTTNDMAALKSSILLQNGTFSQEQEVPNGNYSVSFFYKLLNELANATVTINDVTYNLTSTKYEQFYTGKQNENGVFITQPVEVKSNHLKVSFFTDINNSVEIFDLMVNKGTVKLAYSQNENEVTTDTVNISKGITITSSANDVKFKADSDGIRTFNKNNNEKLSEFTDKGMTTKEAVIENEATIVNVLVQDINGQTWFTRL